MGELFADLPEALEATVEIAMRCAYRVRTRKPILPRFRHGPEAGGARRGARSCAARRRRGWSAPAAHGPAPGLTEQDYRERLAYEVVGHPAA